MKGKTMGTRSMKTFDLAVQISLSLLQDLLASYHPRNFAVRLWDGTIWEPESGQPAHFTLVLQHPGALRRMFLPLSFLSFGEAYIYNDFDIEGDILAAFPIVDHLAGKQWSKTEQFRLGKRLMSLPKMGQVRTGQWRAKLNGPRHSIEHDYQAIAFHYDRSNDFYALWLDHRMIYSCAYFASPNDDLDTAQEHKLEYICRKLRLQPGERLLDIGCGWGGLIIYAAEHYGVEAYGITLSRSQAELAQQRIQQAGLTERCSVEVRDYREVNEPNSYDKLVSIEMIEHVGQSLLSTYFQRAWHLLRPGGVFLNHGVASNANAPKHRKPSFLKRYVFPNGELVPLSTTLQVAEMSGFEVRDVENLREHSMLTGRQWVHRLEDHAKEASTFIDDITYRIWRLYMAAATYTLKIGRNNLYQTLLVKPNQGMSGLPLTRADWYI